MPRLLLLNHCVLFLCCSIYLGTGVSLVFFQLPLEPLLTVDNYELIFVQPVENATSFFTYMTIVMLVTGVIMLATEWFSGLKWVPVIVLLGIVAATGVTVLMIFPVNQELGAGVTDSARFAELISEWASLNRLRASLWALQWFAMLYWFYALARRARADR